MPANEHVYVEKRSVRPWVLGMCFLWGLLLGFVFYVNTDSSADRQAQREEEERQELADQAKQPKAEKADPQEQSITFKQPESGNIGDIEKKIPIVAPLEIKGILGDDGPPKDLKPIPEAPRLAFSYGWGLNGMTTYRPVKPVKIARKAPEIDFSSTSAPTSTAPIDLDDIDGPELEE